ncbi:MAG TPA: alpha/beta hydrolase [Capillimicrobium sp.]|jgi:haloalkane dehalogenase
MLSFRQAGEPARGDVLLVHGFPESSYMWRDVLQPIAAAGWRATAPDLAGFGDSPVDPPGTWTRHVEGLERFRAEAGLQEPLVLVVHDWGGLIGLRWACDHPEAVRGLVISDTGFFSDGKWHDLAAAMRTPGTGEELVANMNRDGLAAALGQLSPGMTDDAIDDYARCLEDDARKANVLELYRSGEFEELEAYEGKLGALGVPTLVLWGENDPFAPVASAERFTSEIPDSRLVVVEGAGHFVFADAPQRCADELVSFLAELP